MRDFLSYDISRYYWVAAFMRVLGNDGPFAVRLSAAVFQALGTSLGVFVCLLILKRDDQVRWIFALLAAGILTLWEKPYYKVYDHASSIVVVFILVVILRTTRPVAWLLAGVCLGMTAIVGRNHGLYGCVAFVFVVLTLWLRSPARKRVLDQSAYFVAGVFIGFSPTLFMMLTVNGFAAAFVDSIVAIFKLGATNIALPVPWPWSVKINPNDLLGTLQNLAIGMGYVLLLIFPLFGMIALAIGRRSLIGDAQKVFLATIAAAIPYAHYSFSRSDVTHLSLGIFPALIGLMVASCLTKGLRPLALAASLLAASVITVPPPVLHRIVQKSWIQTAVAGEQLWVKPDLSRRIEAIDAVLRDKGSDSSQFLAIPNMPSIHAMYASKMAIWEIYALIPRDRDFEIKEIERLQSDLPGLILLSNHALDGNPDFRFSRLHPLTYQWLIANYDHVATIDEDEIEVYSIRRP